MSRRKSIKPALIAVIAIIAICVIVELLFFGNFVSHNYNAIKEEADHIFVDDAISKSFEGLAASRQLGKSMRQAVSEAMTEDMYAAYLGDQFSLQNVDFAVQPSKAIVRNENAAASVDIFIQNNSRESVTIPLDEGWSAFCPQGNQLQYTWDSWDVSCTQMKKGYSGVIDPGETYVVTLAFTDSNGYIADAAALSAELSRPLDGINRIYWFAEYY